MELKIGQLTALTLIVLCTVLAGFHYQALKAVSVQEERETMEMQNRLKILGYYD